jgi:hypothetical protein
MYAFRPRADLDGKRTNADAALRPRHGAEAAVHELSGFKCDPAKPDAGAHALQRLGKHVSLAHGGAAGRDYQIEYCQTPTACARKGRRVVVEPARSFDMALGFAEKVQEHRRINVPDLARSARAAAWACFRSGHERSRAHGAPDLHVARAACRMPRQRQRQFPLAQRDGRRQAPSRPSAKSLPRRRRFSQARSGTAGSSMSPVRLTASCGTTASAPDGMAAPVKIRIAVPGTAIASAPRPGRRPAPARGANQ